MRNRHTSLWIAAMLASGLLLWQSSQSNRADDKKGQPGQETEQSAANGQAEGGPGAADQETKVEVLVGGLDFPTALAARAVSGRGQVEIWVAESGSQRVVRFHSDTPDKTTESIVEIGETAEADTDSPPTRPLPFGLMFLSRNRLLLASGGEPPVRDFDIDDDALPLGAATGKEIAFADEAPKGPVATLARNPDGFYIVGTGQENANAIYRSTLKGTKLAPLEKFRDASLEQGTTHPRALAISSKGYLVVGLAGTDEGEEGESVLAFLDPYRGDVAPIMVLKTGLADIAALAYHPKTGSLYAADSSWTDADKGGIYRLDAKSVDDGGNESCEAVLVAKLPYATALEFDSEGNLYAVSAGGEAPMEEPQGTLVKISGQL